MSSSGTSNVPCCSTCACGGRDSCGGCGWGIECRTFDSGANAGNEGVMTDVPNVYDNEVNDDIIRGGITTRVCIVMLMLQMMML